MKNFLSKHEGQCLYHLLLHDDTVAHPSAECDLAKGGCWVCEGNDGHWVRDCPNKAPEREKLCWCCYLPNVVEGFHLHQPFTRNPCSFRELRRVATKLALLGKFAPFGFHANKDTLIASLWYTDGPGRIPPGYGYLMDLTKTAQGQ